MADLTKLQFRRFNGARVIGKGITQTIEPGAENPVPAHWEKCFADNTFDFLKTLDPVKDAHVGWMGEYDDQTKKFVYIAGMLLPPGTEVPEGYDFRDLPPCRMGVGWIKGVEPDIYLSAHTLTEEEIQKTMYKPDHSFGYSMEVYDRKRFSEALAKGKKKLVLDYWIPIEHRIMEYYQKGDEPHHRVVSLYEALCANNVEKGKIDAIMEGVGSIKKSTKAQTRTAWIASAMERLDESFPLAERKRIREASACCLTGEREKVSKAIAAKGGSLAERVAEANQTPYLFGHSVTLEKDGTITVQFFPDGRESYSCVCLKGAEKPMSKTYCMCCGGHIKHHLQTVLEKELECEIIHTPLTTAGEKPCRMSFSIV